MDPKTHHNRKIRSKAHATALLFLSALFLLLTSCGKEEAPATETGEVRETPVIQIKEAEESNAVSESGDPAEEEQDEPEGQWDADEEFYITEITDEIFARIEGKSFKEDCTLPREDLRYLHVLHKTLEGETKEGEMVVNVHIADTVLKIFRELYESDYPIEKICLVDEYNADDERSMADNNTSCFNFRFVPNTKRISKHGRGLAIDLNPRYNPYVVPKDGGTDISPDNGKEYADRSQDFPYKIDENDLAYRLFTEHGFKWGGAWKNEKDYQHFEIPNEQIREWYDQ